MTKSILTTTPASLIAIGRYGAGESYAGNKYAKKMPR